MAILKLVDMVGQAADFNDLDSGMKGLGVVLEVKDGGVLLKTDTASGPVIFRPFSKICLSEHR